MSGVADRIRTWRPRTPSLPEHLAALVGPDDPFVVAAALARAGITPRFMVTGGILRTPIAGPCSSAAAPSGWTAARTSRRTPSG